MRNLLRSGPVQSTLAVILSAWLKFCHATTRWTYVNRDEIERVWRDGGGVIVCFWHARLSLAPVVWEHARAQPIKGLISLSRDGEFLARAMARLGFPAIRGSSLKKTDPAKAKGGAQAFRDGLKWLKQGGALGITPDGPRGPPEVMAEGAAMLAKASGAPVMLLGISSRPAVRLNTWDRAVFPMPFGKGAIVWERVEAKRDDDPERLCADWGARITALTAEADAIADGEPVR